MAKQSSKKRAQSRQAQSKQPLPVSARQTTAQPSTANQTPAKQSSPVASAAQRREQQREQRQASLNRTQQQQRNKRKVQRKSQRGLWITLGVVVVAIAAVVGVFVYLSSQSSGGHGSSGDTYPSTAASATVVKDITAVEPSALAAVGTGSGKTVTPPTKLNSTSLLTGPDGKPEVFYQGAEYCPYCAAERWAMIVALSRFGTFHNLSQISSSSTDVYANTPTFSFYHSSYTSQYVDFVPLEVQSYQGTTLETPTAAEQQTISTYNPSGSFPFMDIANKYMVTGASYDPQVLSNLDWQSIANSLASPQSSVAQSILGTANYLTAAICEATNQQPASVCGAAPIPQAEQKLNGTTGSSGGNMGVAFAAPAAITRRTGTTQRWRQ